MQSLDDVSFGERSRLKYLFTLLLKTSRSYLLVFPALTQSETPMSIQCSFHGFQLCQGGTVCGWHPNKNCIDFSLPCIYKSLSFSAECYYVWLIISTLFINHKYLQNYIKGRNSANANENASSIIQLMIIGL